MRERPKNLSPPAMQPRVIVGFDSEWTFERNGENRILSWQFVVLNQDTGATSELFIEPRGATRRRRISLSRGLYKALHKAHCDGAIPFFPESLTVACHFARADITTLRDFDSIKRRLTAVRKTYATTGIPLTLRIITAQGEMICNVRLIDTMLLTAANTKLEKLGADLGLPKCILPKGYTKERMDLFLTDRRDEFIEYAMTDARISAQWTARIDGIMNLLGIARPTTTLGGASVLPVEQELERLNVCRNEFLGLEKPRRGKPHPKSSLVSVWPYAAQCYHGGKNIAIALGFSPDGQELVDVDLVSAYTTALALIRIPDWSSARQTTDLTDLAVVEDAMTFAHVKFSFPSATRFPNLPIRTSKNRGLVYPLEGESWCTGLEIVVAIDQGARITPRSGWRVDWLAGAPVRPFEGFTRRINEVRAQAKATSDTILDKTAKEIGNSAYGKVAQAVASQRVIQDDVVFKRTFDAKWGRTERLGPSSITQPMFAGYCTGLVRAALSEALSRLPPSAWVGSATTDGFLFAGDMSDLSTSGPIARAFVAARERITPGRSEIWELKHIIPRALIIKTRSAFTVAPPDWRGEAVCAQAGYRLPDRDAPWLNELERSARWITHYRDRDFETRFENPSLTSLRNQHNKGLDLQRVDRLVRWNADADLKRRLINVHDVDDLITADTAPWRTVDEFEAARDDLDLWRQSERRVMKTAANYADMINWSAAHSSRLALGITSQNRLSPLAVAAMLAAAYGVMGIAKASYATIARIWTALTGVLVTTTTVKNAKRRGAKPDALQGNITHLSDGDEGFACTFLQWRVDAWDFLYGLCKGRSAAETSLWGALRAATELRAMCDEPDLDAQQDLDSEYWNAPENEFGTVGEALFEVVRDVEATDDDPAPSLKEPSGEEPAEGALVRNHSQSIVAKPANRTFACRRHLGARSRAYGGAKGN
jgi:hypothetical protein